LSGELIAILTTISWSIGIFPFTEAAKRVGALPLNQYRLLLAWIIISCIVCVNFLDGSISNLFLLPTSNHYLFLGLSGIIGFTIGDYFSITSFKLLGPKLGSLYTSFAPGAALIIGYLILNESINVFGFIGIIITISGVIWLTLSKKDKHEAQKAGYSRDKKGILFGVLGALCQGAGLVLSKYGMEYSGELLEPMHAVWIRLMFAFSAALFLSIVTNRFWKITKPVLTNQNNNLPFLLFGTLMGPVIGVTLSLYSIQKLEVAVAQTIFALIPLFVLPINYIVYKEKITIQSVFSCLIAMLGVMILVWRNQF
jgi:drug/metabolite transporter (DMT)-like permease